ncbi:conserved hypothetical protein [Phenylobacterium zucineum HLK1]|uniref:EthD domain-containing protein n=1 Tax=Phenylobacterium zucineum (strain HLK1) TaxID=450851 RepID=B4RGM5_PHEZH|nr:EthD domain-containing protein [Phenylobacterium zucineum]ACG78931.1 conserved hypothetical protein [Phenylobacterium zucineum HLK1]
MIKLTFCLHRRPELSREAFQDYWRNTHAPLVRSVAETLRIRRYVQVHSLADEVGMGMAASRGSPGPYDGVAELWFDSIESILENGRRPEAREAAALLLEDERRFIDLARSPIWLGEEHVVI